MRPRAPLSPYVMAGRFGRAIGLALVLASPAPAAAQVSLAGHVRDSTGAPIPRAEIRVPELGIFARADDNGSFSLAGLPAREVLISVRRIGYSPAEGTVAPADVDTLTVVLYAQEAVLEGMRIEARLDRQRPWIEDFDHRRSLGVGAFVTREEIEARNSLRPSDVLRSMPGLRFARGRTGSAVRFVSTPGGRDCAPMIWVDGTRMPGLELDDLTANDIEAMELYRGLSTTPGQFAYPPPVCGTIVVWTRLPGGRRP